MLTSATFVVSLMLAYTAYEVLRPKKAKVKVRKTALGTATTSAIAKRSGFR